MKKIILLLTFLIFCSLVTAIDPYPTANPLSATIILHLDGDCTDATGTQNCNLVGGVYNTSSPLSSGQSVHLRGIDNDYIDSQFDGFNFTQTKTICYWFYTNVWGSADFHFGFDKADSRRSYFQVYTTLDYYFSQRDGSLNRKNQEKSTGTIRDLGKWQHICIIDDGGSNGANMRIYVNGTLQTPTGTTNEGILGEKYTDDMFFGACNDDGADKGNININMDDILIWNETNITQSEVTEIYQGNWISGLNVHITAPTNNTKIGLNNITQLNSKIYINGTHDNSSSVTCGINDTRFSIATPTLPSNWSFINNTLLTDGLIAVNVYCNITGSQNGTADGYFEIDVNQPVLSTNFTNNTIVYKQNLTAHFNFTDSNVIHRFNVTIDSIHIYGKTNINSPTYEYNFTNDLSAFPAGKHTITIEFADGHTANRIGDYEIDRGLFSDYLKYQFTEGGFIKTYSKSHNLLDNWQTEKKTDRYIQIFYPNQKSDKITLIEESNLPIHIIEQPGRYKGQWIIIGNHWKDYVLEDEPNSKVSINRITDNKVEVTITGITNTNKLKFSSIGDINIVEKSFVFHKLNLTETYESILLNGYNSDLNLTAYFGELYNCSGYSPLAKLEWNKTNYTISPSKFNCTHALFGKVVSLPQDNLPQQINHTWYFNLSKSTTLYNTSLETQYSQEIIVDLCNDTVNEQIINMSYYDEISGASIDVNHNYVAYIFDSQKYYNLTGNFSDDTSNKFCCNVDPTNATINFNMWGEFTLSKTGYTTRIVNVDPATPIYLSNNPIARHDFYLIDILNSTTVTYNWYTTRFGIIDGTMRIYQCNSSGGLELIDSVPIIDSQTSANIELLSQAYAYDVIVDGLIYRDYNAYTRCHVESTTERTFYVALQEPDITDIIGFNTINCRLNKTGPSSITMTWEANPENTSYVQGCFQIYRNSVTGNTLIYQNCSQESDGYKRSFILPVNGNDYSAKGKLIQGSNSKWCENEITLLAGTQPAGNFGITGLIAVFFLICGIALIYAGDNQLQLIGGAVAVCVAWILGIFNVGWEVVTSIIILLIVVAIVGRYSKE